MFESPRDLLEMSTSSYDEERYSTCYNAEPAFGSVRRQRAASVTIGDFVRIQGHPCKVGPKGLLGLNAAVQLFLYSILPKD